MAIMNPYNYAKPRHFIRLEKEEKEEKKPTPSAVHSTAAQDRSGQYIENKVMSAKPEELTYMLYEGLVKFIKTAVMYLEMKRMEDVNYNAQRAQAIIDELRSTLNKDIPISDSLDQLYEYMSFKLVEANVDKNELAFKEALEIAENFKETWRQAFDLKG
ncbi:MAG: flagellar secretion chaperone FliS [Clostridiales bacterium]|nr:flagellar secretion chaperone FliS [Clostridiales bacterium]